LFAPLAIQYTFGALLGASFVFYWYSAAVPRSRDGEPWIFVFLPVDYFPPAAPTAGAQAVFDAGHARYFCYHERASITSGITTTNQPEHGKSATGFRLPLPAAAPKDTAAIRPKAAYKRPSRTQLAGLLIAIPAAFYLGFLLPYGWLLVR